MSTELAIYNMAISLVGGRHLLASITDNSPEAEQCRLWYIQSRDYVFRQAYWPSIRRSATLALLSERATNGPWDSTQPVLPFRYAYALPADMLAARELYDAQTRLPGGKFTVQPIMNNNVLTRAISTDCANAVLNYTAAVLNPGDWDVNLRNAVCHMLASNLSMALTARPDVKANMLQQAEFYIAKALESQANVDHKPIADQMIDTAQSRSGVPWAMGPGRA